jgi:serine protease
MQTRTAAAAAALVALLASPIAVQAPLAQVAAVPETGRVIVKYRADSSLARKHALTFTGKRILQTEALGSAVGIALQGGPEIAERAHVVVAKGLGSAALAARLAAHPDVEYAVVDQKRRAVAVPNDPFYATRAYDNATTPTAGGPLVGQWYLKPSSASLPSAINAEGAWDVTTGSASIVVAVLDSGARLDHPDLQGGKVVAGYDFVAEDSAGVFASANDGDGRDADPSDPGDFVTSAEAANGVLKGCDVVPSSWHGTQTMSIVGAQTNNAVGMASVGWNVRVQPVRVLGKCGGYDSDIIAGMRWAAGLAVSGAPVNATPAKVINMSLGGTGACTTAYRDAVAEVNAAGAVVVASAGNSVGHAVGTPANCAGVIAVAGLRHVGTKVGFSDVGPEVALSAPGGNCVNTASGSPCLYPILTATNAGTTTPVAGGIYSDAFNASYGTSFSAPLVSGVAALMLSRQPTMTPAEVRATLVGTTRAFPTTGGEPGDPVCQAPTGADQLQCYCTTSTCGSGMLDARSAVLAAGNVFARITVATATPTATQPVTVTATPLVPAGQTVTGYAWTITDAGTTGATFSGAASAASVTVLPTAAGTFTVRLVTTSSAGTTSTASTSVVVAAVPAPAPAESGGGGGALGAGWLVLLAGAVGALRLASRRT